MGKKKKSNQERKETEEVKKPSKETKGKYQGEEE